MNEDTVKQEIEADRLDKMGDTNGKINPYHEIITSKVEKRWYIYITDGTVVDS